MKINLLEIPIYYISLEKNKENQKNIENILNKLGFKDIRKFLVAPHPRGKIAGCADSHMQILQKEKFNEKLFSPFIIIEEDCEINTDFDEIVDIPDDADALYIGISAWGRYMNYSGPLNHINVINNKISRIFNMLSTHAIMYISKRYIDICSVAAEYALKTNTDVDIAFAEIQKMYNVYAVNNPFFYQKSSELVTNGTIWDCGFDLTTAKKFFDLSVEQNKNKNIYESHHPFKKLDCPTFLPTKLMEF